MESKVSANFPKVESCKRDNPIPNKNENTKAGITAKNGGNSIEK